MSIKTSMRRREARLKRHRRVRRAVTGSAARPRLCVFRSHKHIYAQVIDDRLGRTLASASTVEPDIASTVAGKSKREQAKIVGRTVADRAKAAGVEAVVFDRGGYGYHGRVRELADEARVAGLAF
jgi:large subunit ribosomal protein L18